MKNAISLLLSAAVISASFPTVVLAQASPQDQATITGEDLSPEERARQVEQLASSGADAYRGGDFESAIDAFKQAYALEPVPNLLYNIAKSYEKLEEYADAVDYYQKFVVAPEVDSSARQSALDRIESLREIAQLKSQQEGAAGGDGDSDEKSSQALKPAQPADEEPTNYAAYGTLGGSVLLLGGGIAMGFLASGEADTAKDGETYEIRSDAQSSGKTYALVADGMFVGAAVLAGVGAYFLFSDSGTEREPAANASASSRTVISPWVTPRSAGVGMSLDF